MYVLTAKSLQNVVKRVFFASGGKSLAGVPKYDIIVHICIKIAPKARKKWGEADFKSMPPPPLFGTDF